MRNKSALYRFVLSTTFLLSSVLMSVFPASGKVVASYIPSQENNQAREDPVSLPLKAPWLAGVKFHMGGGPDDGSFYGEFKHTDFDAYALDFNGAVNTEEPVNDKTVLAAAVADGVVRERGWNGTYGNTVVIGHPGGYQSRYAHLRNLDRAPAKGDFVAQGTPIGYIDDTGMELGEHLHFAMYYCEKDCETATNQKAQRPEPMEKSFKPFTNGDQLTSTNYGVGIEAYTCQVGIDCLDESEWNQKYHPSFMDTYYRYNGQAMTFGSSLDFVKKFDGTDFLYQEFAEFTYDQNQCVFNKKGTLFEWNSIAYYMVGPIWDEYVNQNGPKGTLGKPISDTYQWIDARSGKINFRNDFENGSLIATPDGKVETWNSKNAKWEVKFFSFPDFTYPLMTRYDKSLNLTWTPMALSSQKNWFSIENFSSLIATTNFDKNIVLSKIDALVQGYAEIHLDGKVINPPINSPDQEESQQYTKFSFTNPHLEVRFSQEYYKQARLKVDANQMGVFNSPGDGQFLMMDIPQFSQIAYADYTPPSYQEQPTSSTETVLVFDTSGSMSDSDSSGISKIEAAQRAGLQILNVIEAENIALGASNQIGIASYNYTANVDNPLTTDIALLKDTLVGLSANGSTAMADGLQTGMNLFSSGSGNKVLILLSDGLPNISLNSGSSQDYDYIKQQVIDLATQAGQQNICVNTVGFGDPNQGSDSIDEDFLRAVASASGCGKYYSALDAIELANVYVELRHTSTGVIQFKQTGQIAAGEEKPLGVVEIPEYQEIFLMTVNWPGSKLQPVVIDPSGITVDNSYPGVSISESSTLVSYILNNPIPGNWQLSLIGIDIPEGVCDYNAILSTRVGVIPLLDITPEPTPVPPPPVGGVSIFVVLLVLAASGIGIFAYSNVLKRAGKKTVIADASGGKLYGRTGAYRQKIISLHDGFVIGRGERCDLKLLDSSVGRHHTQFRFAQGSWYVQDMGSIRGTYVNGARINAIRLTSGDTIAIGSDTFTFISNS